MSKSPRSQLQSQDSSEWNATPRAPKSSSGLSQRSGEEYTHSTTRCSTPSPEAVRFDPIREICGNRQFLAHDSYVCVYTHGHYACTRQIHDVRRTEAVQLAVKIHSRPAKDITWADLWKFVTNMHCVQHFDEAVNFELPYSMEMLVAVVQEQQMQEEKQKNIEEWEAELRRGEEKKDARRYAWRYHLKG